MIYLPSSPNASSFRLFVRSVKNGLVMAIPIVMIGSFSLVFKFFPVPAYQTFQQNSEILPIILTFVNNATFGMLSIFMTVFIGMSHSQLTNEADIYPAAFPAVSLACFAILSGFLQKNFSPGAMGVKGMFSAIFAATIS